MCLCPKHATQLRKYGKIIDPTRRTIQDKNEFIFCDGYAKMIIRDKRNNIVATTKIDLEDVERVSKYKWNIVPSGKDMYIYTKPPFGHMKLHRFIIGYHGTVFEVDHINRDTLDNRKDNLRLLTRSENACNNGASHIRQIGDSWTYEIVRYGHRFRKSGFKSREEADKAMQELLYSVSMRAGELITEFNLKLDKNPFKGVYLHYGKYIATYYHKKKKYYAGTYDTPEEANAARERLIKSLNLE